MKNDNVTVTNKVLINDLSIKLTFILKTLSY